MRLTECDQGSIEWFAARSGIVTASRLKDVMATLKSGKPSSSRDDYVMELVAERVTGQAYQHYANAAMQHGTECEPMARAAYEAETGALVEQVGFCRHDTLPFGASPDGLVDAQGAIEIKCPFHLCVSLRTRLEGMPAEHMAQLQGVLFVTGRAWCDFISFDPRLPASLQLYRQRVLALPEWKTKIVKAVEAVESEITNIVERLKCK